jgi:hypothetical protein
MELTWGIAAVWLGLALVASLLSIRFKMSVALVEILVTVVIGSAVVPTMIAQTWFRPDIGPPVFVENAAQASPNPKPKTYGDQPISGPIRIKLARNPIVPRR